MPTLSMRTESGDVIDLDEYLEHDIGIQVLRGLTGFGLPPVKNQWLEGAGNGARFRGRRTLSRTVDLPLLLSAHDREGLVAQTRRLSLALRGTIWLDWKDGDLTWTAEGHHEGGGDYQYGTDTNGEDWLLLTVTIRFGDPFWTSTKPTIQTVVAGAGVVTPFFTNFVEMNLDSSEVIGSLVINNIGDTEAYPIWQIDGPGSDIELTSPSGETLLWGGTLLAGDSITIDTGKGTVVDQDGTNVYSSLNVAPRFWAFPPGITTATATMAGTSDGVPGPDEVVGTNYHVNPGMVSGGGGTNISTGETPSYLTSGGPLPDTDTYYRIYPDAGGFMRVGVKFAHGLAGKLVTVSTYMRPTETILDVGVYITIDSVNAFGAVTTQRSGAKAVWKNEWVRFDFTLTLPEDAVESSFYLENIQAWPQGVGIENSAWMIDESMSLNPYFDGGTTDTSDSIYAWTGTENASASTKSSTVTVGVSKITCSIKPRRQMVI